MDGALVGPRRDLLSVMTERDTAHFPCRGETVMLLARVRIPDFDFAVFTSETDPPGIRAKRTRRVNPARTRGDGGPLLGRFKIKDFQHSRVQAKVGHAVSVG